MASEQKHTISLGLPTPISQGQHRTRVGDQRVKAAGVLIQEGGHIVHLRGSKKRGKRG